MSATIRELTIDAGVVKYDSDMKMSALKGLLGGAQDGDLDVIVESLSQFVTEWPFKGKPSNVEAWDELRRSEFSATVNAITDDLQTLGEA